VANQYQPILDAIIKDNIRQKFFQIEIKESKPIVIPKMALEFLNEIMEAMGRGQAMYLVPLDGEVTTQQAADMLGVSRPYLVKLLEQKKIPFHKVGKHRRILIEDLKNYREIMQASRKMALRELSRKSIELGLKP